MLISCSQTAKATSYSDSARTKTNYNQFFKTSTTKKLLGGVLMNCIKVKDSARLFNIFHQYNVNYKPVVRCATGNECYNSFLK